MHFSSRKNAAPALAPSSWDPDVRHIASVGITSATHFSSRKNAASVTYPKISTTVQVAVGNLYFRWKCKNKESPQLWPGRKTPKRQRP
jgi:hypothetical protein